MSATIMPIKRHPVVPLRQVALDEWGREDQIRRGHYLTERGERFALPYDDVRDKARFRGEVLWAQDELGRVFRPGVRFEKMAYGREDLPARLREVYDRLSGEEMKQLYRAHTGHDLHFSLQGNLYARHFHAGWANPFTGEVEPPIDLTFATFFATHFGLRAHELTGGVCRLETCPADVMDRDGWARVLAGVNGFTEDLGWLSGGLVTDAFVSEIVDELVSATGSEFPDFDYHEVGTDNTAESNNHTALQVSSGISRQSGTPTDSDPDYVNVATITADATETWQEHGLFNNSTGAAMLDRSLTGGQSVVSSDQVEYTYTLTCNPET